MGRKSLDKPRKSQNAKTELWLRTLFPKLQQKTLANLSMDDLAVLTEKSKSTLYQYFETKEAILEACIMLILNDLWGYRKLLAEPDPLERYRHLISFLGEHLQQTSPGFLSQLPDALPQVWQQIAVLQHQLITDLESLYTEGIEKGIFQKVNLSLLVDSDIHFIQHTIINPIFADIPLQSLINDYVMIRINGISNK